MKVVVPYGKNLPVREIASFQKAAAKVSHSKLIPIVRIVMLLLGAALIAATFLFSGGTGSALVLLILGLNLFKRNPACITLAVSDMINRKK